MQSIQSIEEWYQNRDPWGYETNKDDEVRKKKVISACKKKKRIGKYTNAIDIGCGEGFITGSLPAKNIYGFDLSETALNRLPREVIPVKKLEYLDIEFDLIVATGVLYEQYDYISMNNWIKDHAKGIVVTSNIKEWEINTLPEDKIVHSEEFKYRDYTQVLRIYDFTA